MSKSIESQFHNWLTETNLNPKVNIQDDASYHSPSNQQFALSAKDLFVEDVHFRNRYWSYEDIGFKATLRAISDIYAMNGKPEQILLGISHSPEQSLDELKKIVIGVRDCCKEYSCRLVGGDTNSNQSHLTISVTALGGSDRVALQSTAKEGDTLYFCGQLALPYVCLSYLESNTTLPPSINKNAFFRTQLPYKALESFSQNHPINSLTDVTDGLIEELERITSKSKVSASLNFNSLKILLEKKHLEAITQEKISLEKALLMGGDEYGFLFSSPHYTDKYPECYPIGSLRGYQYTNQVLMPDQSPRDFSSF